MILTYYGLPECAGRQQQREQRGITAQGGLRQNTDDRCAAALTNSQSDGDGIETMSLSYEQPLDHDRAAQRRDLIDDTVFYARKSGLTAYLLWTFFGGIGLHNFYLRRPIPAALQMAGTLFVYCTYVSDDPWPLIGYVAGIPLGISLLVDMFRIPGYIAACSERLRASLEDGID
jgi:hypothetical protein